MNLNAIKEERKKVRKALPFRSALERRPCHLKNFPESDNWVDHRAVHGLLVAEHLRCHRYHRRQFRRLHPSESPRLPVVSRTVREHRRRHSRQKGSQASVPAGVLGVLPPRLVEWLGSVESQLIRLLVVRSEAATNFDVDSSSRP